VRLKGEGIAHYRVGGPREGELLLRGGNLRVSRNNLTFQDPGYEVRRKSCYNMARASMEMRKPRDQPPGIPKRKLSRPGFYGRIKEKSRDNTL